MSFRYIKNMPLDSRKEYRIFCNTGLPPGGVLHNELDIYCHSDETRTAIPFPNYMVYVMDEMELPPPYISILETKRSYPYVIQNPCSEIMSNGKSSICTLGLPEGDIVFVHDEWPVLYEYSIPCIHSGCRGPAQLYQNHAMTWQCTCHYCHVRSSMFRNPQQAFVKWCVYGLADEFLLPMPVVIAVEKRL